MRQSVISGDAPFDHFAAGIEEYAGRAPADAETTEIAVRNAVKTIGELMREDRQRRERDGLPEIALPEDIAAEIAVAQATRAPQRKAMRTTPGVLEWLRGFRPGPVHAAWALIFLAVIVWPKAVLVALFAGFVICLVGVALFGPELLERLRDRVSGRLRGRGHARAHRDAEPEMFDDLSDPFERLRDQR